MARPGLYWPPGGVYIPPNAPNITDLLDGTYSVHATDNGDGTFTIQPTT